MAVVEAMAAGAPVLAYRRGSMAELIQDRATGYLVDDEDSMVDALSAVEKLSRKRCREWVAKEFTVARMVDGYERVYQKIVQAQVSKVFSAR